MYNRSNKPRTKSPVLIDVNSIPKDQFQNFYNHLEKDIFIKTLCGSCYYTQWGQMIEEMTEVGNVIINLSKLHNKSIIETCKPRQAMSQFPCWDSSNFQKIINSLNSKNEIYVIAEQVFDHLFGIGTSTSDSLAFVDKIYGHPIWFDPTEFSVKSIGSKYFYTKL